MFRNYHFILISIYPVLFLYSSNLDMAVFSTAVVPMLLMLASAFVLYILFNLILKSSVKSSLVVSLLAFLFFSYGHVHSFIYSFFLKYEIDLGTKHEWRFFVVKESTLWLLLAVDVILIIWFCWKLRKIKIELLDKISRSLNVVSIFLVIFPLITIAFSLAGKDDSQGTTERPEKVSEETTGSSLAYKPDIYFIILDGYAREDAFTRHYNFDNRPFLNSLNSKGFKIFPKARGSYNWTALSLSSTLNMRHLNFLTEELGVKNTSYRKLYSMIRNNKTITYLKNKGYRFVHLNSTWGPTIENPNADTEIGCVDGLFQVEFYRVLAESSLLKLWENPVGTDLASCHLFNFRKLETIAELKGPKFVFSHIIPPHHPYLFDRDGNILRDATVSNQFEFQKKLWGDKDKYIDQVIYLNERVNIFIDSILLKSESPPIILIQSDHGPTLLDESLNYHKDFMDVKFSILTAVYLPGDPDIIPDNLAAVNILARVFNHYFNDDLPIQDKAHYFSDYRSLYNFKPVTFKD